MGKPTNGRGSTFPTIVPASWLFPLHSEDQNRTNWFTFLGYLPPILSLTDMHRSGRCRWRFGAVQESLNLFLELRLSYVSEVAGPIDDFDWYIRTKPAQRFQILLVQRVAVAEGHQEWSFDGPGISPCTPTYSFWGTCKTSRRRKRPKISGFVPVSVIVRAASQYWE
jgi:hypothetical protein